MKFDFNKILEYLNPTYNQLKMMLIVSVFIILSTGISLNSCSDTKENGKDGNQVNLNELEKKIKDQELSTNYKFFELYNDVLDLNYRNNIHWNTKFNIFLKYGNDNELFEELIKLQDEQQRLYEEENRNKMKYRLLPDSLAN
ncbi:MAG: hypothetical protein ACOC3V_03155 [bacterium]